MSNRSHSSRTAVRLLFVAGTAALCLQASTVGSAVGASPAAHHYAPVIVTPMSSCGDMEIVG